jgi:hypothetical protein
MSCQPRLRKTLLTGHFWSVAGDGLSGAGSSPVAGVGTVVALMLPFTIVTSVAWIVLFLAWYLLGLPFGPS